MNLSKNFTLAEMTKSSTAKRLGIDNTANEAQIESLRELCQKVLQPIRDNFGPVRVTSGLRVPALNTAIGGSSSSQHCKGEASDIDFGNRNGEVFEWIKANLNFDQLIWEFGDSKCPDWIHISYKYGKNRKQILKAVKQNGKTKYLPF
jgi:zinc D-Ala-D-Ala carboxypeptidase